MKNKNKTQKKMTRRIIWKIKILLKKIKNGIIVRKIKQCYILFVSFFKALGEILITKKIDGSYVSLTPTKDADKDEIYCNALKYAIDNEEIKNIAIAGNYGSGKSSVIKTFFEKLENKKYNPIYVSLGAFNKKDFIENSSETTGEEKLKELQTKNEFYHTLEKSILQQLLYQANEKEVPLSRFKRISKHSKCLLNIEALAIIFSLSLLLCMIFPAIIDYIISNYNIIIAKIPRWIIHILILVLLIVIDRIIYKLLFFLSTKFNISKFKIKDAEVEIDSKPESIFNKYLDEIIYFFQVTNHKVVVIEDLDRYEGNASFIFQKLRELNTLINSSNQVKYEVDFIFAIRDDFFNDYEERTKFFDYIIPIIPISSTGNSNEIIWKRLESLKQKGKIDYKFDKNYIDDIAILIEDKRLIDNIINEFIIYKNKLNNKHMDDKQLFAIIIYKNMCPKAYADLQKNKGNIVEILKNKKKSINNLIKELQNRKKELQEQKEKVKNECLNNVKELKAALVSNIYNFSSYTNYEREFQFDNDKISINTFLSSSVDIEKIKNSNITFRTKSYSYIQLEEKDVFSSFGNKLMFLNRLENIEKGKEIKLKELQDEIEEIDFQIININRLTLKELINRYGIGNIFNEDINYIEKFLITKGYITEEYKDYITLFVPGNLTKEDNDFVFAVKTREMLPYNYKLNNVKNILKKLNENDFETNAILNFDLLDYLITNNIKDKELKIVQLLDKSNENDLQFIDDFIENYTSSSNFINVLIENSTRLWKKIYKKFGNKDYIDKWIIQFLLNENSLKYVDSDFVNYINKHEDLDKSIKDEQIERIIKSLKHLNVKLSNIQDVNNEKFLNQIYINELYELNSTMIRLFLQLNNNEIKQFEDKNLTIIMNSENILKEYVLNNFEEYFNLCYTLNNSNKDEKNAIVEILNNENISIDIKKQIIKNEDFKEYNIENLDEDLVNTILYEDKLKISYNNILAIMINENELTVTLINHISNHIKEYASKDINECESVYDREIINSFIQRYIFCKDVNYEDFKILVITFNVKFAELKEIEINKLEYLIDNEMIEFNLNNFQFIKNNALHKLLKFIINNIEQFVENLDKYNISEIQNELLINKEINKENKIKIIETVDISKLSNNTIMELILIGIIPTDESINEKVLEDSTISIDEKLSVLKILLKNTDDKNQGTSYIHLIGNEYNDINTSKNACSISSSKIDIELCNILKEKNYISSYKTGKRKNIILYNKWNR